MGDDMDVSESGGTVSDMESSFKSALTTQGVEVWGFPTVSPSIRGGVGFPLNHDETFCQIELILVDQRMLGEGQN